MARAYEAGGAAAISVLTEPNFFDGDLAHLSEARGASALLLLQKDFIIDEYQLFKAKFYHADAVLLIASVLDVETLSTFGRLAQELNLDAIVEVHDLADVKKAIDVDAKIIGINNRDLKTFATDLNHSQRLAALIPDDVVLISASGVESHADIEALARSRIKIFLVGKAIVRAPDPTQKIKELRGETT